MKMATGSNIRTLRNLAGLTLEQLSELSGVEVGTISALENRDSSRSKYFPAIAQAFGITTDELAISLTIIALLLLVVMKGQTLIDQAKAKDVVAIVEDLRIATSSFRNRFNHLPGDWPYTANEIPGVTAATTVGTNGNGVIEGDVDATDGTADAGSEVAALPLQLFGAGFIGKVNHGDTQRRLSTSFGPVHVVSKATAEGLVAGFSANNPAARSAIVFNKLPCDVAREVDSKVDDGSIATGHASSTACANGIVQWYAVAM